MTAGEPIRLLVWDLDETFWQGTLTEGGITYRQETHAIVVALAQRGIPSAISSKNDIGPVREVLTAHGIWNYFVFPSVDWTPKGPRLRALVDAVQLRPETVAFIDDNALNRAEAEHFVPGLRAFSETIISTLLDNTLLRGKPDPELTRLRQYRLLQEKQAALTQADDRDAFLRASNIRVSFDHDLDDATGSKLDRAIELINRTNQLNFTKRRLPEDAEAARTDMREQLKSLYMKAGLISVRDRYGDYGVCGLYMMHQRHGHPARLVQFCFSCRILNMGVETWVYRLLGRPALDVAPPVLVDVAGDTRDITWINVTTEAGAGEPTTSSLDYVLLRGGCDIDAVAHYFATGAGRVVRELHEVRDGLEPSVSHSIMLRHAIEGASLALREAAQPFGFRHADFESLSARAPSIGAQAAWIFSFVHDNQTMLYRYKPTGELLPVRFYKSADLGRSYIGQDPAEIGVSRPVLDHLEKHFDFVGGVPDDLFVETLRLAFARAPSCVRVFVLLGNELAANRLGKTVQNANMVKRNGLICEAASGFKLVETVSLKTCLSENAVMPLGNHYDRQIYYQIYKYIRSRLSAPG